MQFITSGNRIAVENFTLGDLYTITFTSGTYINSACIGIGENFVSFQRNEPELLFTLNMETAELVSSIDLYAGGTGTNNYNELTNKPQIGGVELVGNKSLSDLGIQAEITEESPLSSSLVSGLGSAAAADSSDFATAAQGALADSAIQSAGTGLTKDGTTLNHSNSVTAQTSASFSSITFDAQGHITGSTAATTAQLNAINSGITSTDVAQIETNKTNILYNTNNGVKNLAPLNAATTANTGYFGNTSVYLPADTYIISFKLTSTGGFGLGITVDGSNISKNSTSPPYSNTLITHEITANIGITAYQFYANGGATVTDFMICPKSLYDADPTYQPYALPNTTLTPALVECVDNGKKNVYKLPDTITNDAGLTITTNPTTGVMTVSGTANKSRYIQMGGNLSLHGRYIVQSNPSVIGSSSTYYLHLEQSNYVGANDVGDGNYDESTNVYNSDTCKLYLRVLENANFGTGVTFKPIICDRALWDVSHTYQPYALSNVDLTAATKQNETNISSLNTLIATYRFNNATPATITLPSSTSRTFMLIGYLQGIGNVNYTLEIDGNGVLTVKNSYNGTAVSSTGIAFDSDTKILTLTGLTAGYSTATLITTTQ